MAKNTFSMTFKNSTGKDLWFGVYQLIREIPSLKSVVWYACKALPQQQGKIEVQMQYGVGVGRPIEESIVTDFAVGVANADKRLGAEYEVTKVNGNQTISQSDISVPSGELRLKNNTDSVLDLCFTAAGNVICFMQTAPGKVAVFRDQPTYCVAVYNPDRSNIVGGPVDDGIVAGPLAVEYKDKSAFPEIECVLDKGAYILKALG